MEIRITQSKQLFHMSFLVSLGIISSNKQQKMNTENRKERKESCNDLPTEQQER